VSRKRTVNRGSQVMHILTPLIGNEGVRRGISPNKITPLVPLNTPKKLCMVMLAVSISPRCLIPVNPSRGEGVPRFDSALLMHHWKEGGRASGPVPKLKGRPL